MERGLGSSPSDVSVSLPLKGKKERKTIFTLEQNHNSTHLRVYLSAGVLLSLLLHNCSVMALTERSV